MDFEFELKKLSPKKGDLIQVKTPNLLRSQELAALQNAIGQLKESGGLDNVSFIIVGDDYDFDRIPEERMNELGWYKKE